MAKKLYVVVRNAELHDDDGEFVDFISNEEFYFLDKSQAENKDAIEQEREADNDGECVAYTVVEKQFSDAEFTDEAK